MALWLLLLPMALVLPTSAWRLDTDSCKDTVLQEHLRNSVEEAFDVASGALDELNKSPRNPEVNRLLELLFAPKGTTGDQYNVQHLVDTFKGIGAMSQENTDSRKYHNKDDFVLFCNGDRIRKVDKTEDNTGWEDTYSGHDAPSEPCTKTGATDLTLAETYQMDDDEGDPLAGEPCDQLQLCPWFLDWYQAETYKTWKDINSKKSKNAKWAVPFLSGAGSNKNKWWAPLTPIDGTALMTKVIIHEMTHMRLGGPTWPPHKRVGRTVDVKTKLGRGLRIPGALWDVAYGWTAAMRLAKEDPNWMREDALDPDKVRFPHQNADSIALFASATRLLRDDFNTRVTDKGVLEALQPLSRRDQSASALRYRSVPEVIEGFLERSREEQSNRTVAI